MGKRFYCDVETTGINPKVCGVIQLSAIIELNGAVAESIDLRIRPFAEDVIDPAALKINRVTREDLTSPTYLPPREAHRMLVDKMSGYIDRYNKRDKFHFVGYNCQSFDAEIVRRWFSQCGDKYYGSWFWHPTIDVMLLAAYSLRHERAALPNFRLETVARHLNLPWDEEQAHDAMYDIEITRQVLHALEKGTGNAER